MEKIKFLDAADRWFDYKSKNSEVTEEYLQSELRERFLKYLRNNKVTQRQICKITGINESVLSQWKNKRFIGFQTLNKMLDTDAAGALLIYLEDQE